MTNDIYTLNYPDNDNITPGFFVPYAAKENQMNGSGADAPDLK